MKGSDSRCAGRNPCARCLRTAGLGGVDVKAIDIPTPFADFDDYWQPFLGGQGPAPAYAMSQDEAARSRLRERIRERIPVGRGRLDRARRARVGRSRNRRTLVAMARGR